MATSFTTALQIALALTATDTLAPAGSVTVTNRPPQVRIIFPEPGMTLFNLNTKIKTEAFDPDGSISEVRFYIDEILIGTATNSPFNYLAEVKTPHRSFKAIVRDDKGVEAESAPVRVVVSQAPVPSIVTLEPRSGTLVPAGTDLELKADVVARDGRLFPNRVVFYLDGSVVGRADAGPVSATNPPVTFTLTNLVEGEHEISVANEYADCACPSHTIRAVNLAIRDPILTADHQLDFEVITAFPGEPTVIEFSTVFGAWTELDTVTPETNYFRFVAPIEPGISHRWYRVSLAEIP